VVGEPPGVLRSVDQDRGAHHSSGLELLTLVADRLPELGSEGFFAAKKPTTTMPRRRTRRDLAPHGRPLPPPVLPAGCPQCGHAAPRWRLFAAGRAVDERHGSSLSLASAWVGGRYQTSNCSSPGRASSYCCAQFDGDDLLIVVGRDGGVAPLLRVDLREQLVRQTGID